MKNIMTAIAAFQQECPPIHQGSKAGKDSFGYTYASLGEILEVINPLMAKHKLGFTQLVEAQTIKTIILHTESGEFIESHFDIPQGVELRGMNIYQSMGAAITYIRRYAISAALGIVTDKDTDAQGESKPSQEPTKTELPWLNHGTKPWKQALEKKAPLSKLKEYYRVSRANGEQYEEELSKIK